MKSKTHSPFQFSKEHTKIFCSQQMVLRGCAALSLSMADKTNNKKTHPISYVILPIELDISLFI